MLLMSACSLCAGVRRRRGRSRAAVVPVDENPSQDEEEERFETKSVVDSCRSSFDVQ